MTTAPDTLTGPLRAAWDAGAQAAAYSTNRTPQDIERAAWTYAERETDNFLLWQQLVEAWQWGYDEAATGGRG